MARAITHTTMRQTMLKSVPEYFETKAYDDLSIMGCRIEMKVRAKVRDAFTKQQMHRSYAASCTVDMDADPHQVASLIGQMQSTIMSELNRGYFDDAPTGQRYYYDDYQLLGKHGLVAYAKDNSPWRDDEAQASTKSTDET